MSRLAIIVILTLGAGCTEEEHAHQETGVKNDSSAIQADWQLVDRVTWRMQDGAWIICYPEGLQAMAKGVIRNGKKVDQWCYWYEDGSPMMLATYDAHGVPNGPWVAFEVNGEVNPNARYLDSNDRGLRLYAPGIGDVDWLTFEENIRSQAGSIMPTPWPGNAFLVGGVPERRIASEEVEWAHEELARSYRAALAFLSSLDQR